MKLVAAKCPSCGATIDVNPKNETMKCNYCKQAILIDEAIKKYKVEISGSVEVKNLPKIENLLKLANRHYEDKSYEEAYKEYDQIIKLDADNTVALLRYGICKTLLNNYIDFDMQYLINAFNNVIKISKDNNEYDEKKDSFVDEVFATNSRAQNATVEYYNSYKINYSELNQVHEKLLTCLDLYELLFTHANEEMQKIIAKRILFCINSILADKSYKTGKGEYGGTITEPYKIDNELKKQLLEKEDKYNLFLNPEYKRKASTNPSNIQYYIKQITSSEYTHALIILVPLTIFCPPIALVFFLFLKDYIDNIYFNCILGLIITILSIIWFAHTMAPFYE